jgi:hypothetical protein
VQNIGWQLFLFFCFLLLAFAIKDSSRQHHVHTVLCALQAEVSRLMAEVSDLKCTSGDRATLAADLAALKAIHETAVGRLAGLEGADGRAAQLTADLDRLRERLDKSEGQVGPPLGAGRGKGGATC